MNMKINHIFRSQNTTVDWYPLSSFVLLFFNTQQIISSDQIIIVYASYLPLKEVVLVVSYLYNPNIYLVICIIFNKHTESERKCFHEATDVMFHKDNDLYRNKIASQSVWFCHDRVTYTLSRKLSELSFLWYTR